MKVPPLKVNVESMYTMLSIQFSVGKTAGAIHQLLHLVQHKPFYSDNPVLTRGTTMTIKPYGSWKSPITSDLIVSETVELGYPFIDGDTVYWIEMRPAEKGRYVIVKWSPDGKITDITPQPFNARTRVHEYGGGSFTVKEGVVYFSNFSDQRIYCQNPGKDPVPLTEEKGMRYADSVIDGKGNILCVREDHTSTGEAVNTLVSINRNGESDILVCGNDFYSSPRLSPDGSLLAWLTWNHPNMPWDGTELWVASLTNGRIDHAEKVAGGVHESIFQPEWSPSGVLHFVSDKNGWWNLYRYTGDKPEVLVEMEAEFGVPHWSFGRSTYDFAADCIVCTYTQKGVWYLAVLCEGDLELIETPYTSIKYVRAAPSLVIFRGGSPTASSALVYLDLDTRCTQVLRRSSDIVIDAGYISVPQPVEFPTENGLTAHAFFYPPKNRDYTAPPHEKPPLIVISHGGPTEATSSTLSLRLQYWTSRGFAVLDVNYGGSTGYGRQYRQRLINNWGIVDMNDCVNGAQYLVQKQKVDKTRLAIRGGSAGGYTTLRALTVTNVFKAGASYYGVSDLEALTKETHKFESHYLDRLIGPYPACRTTYKERSPIHAVEGLSCPVIFFQGLEDKIVLPNQAEMMVEALRKKGLPVAYIPFEGEQHGFRQSENIKRTLDAELYFYSKIFHFALADPVKPVDIENL